MFCDRLLLLVHVDEFHSYDYCSLSRDHLLCARSPGHHPRCGQVLSSGVTRDQAALITDVHNKLRSLVASGKTSHPPASNMRQLGYTSLSQIRRFNNFSEPDLVFDHE